MSISVGKYWRLLVNPLRNQRPQVFGLAVLPGTTGLQLLRSQIPKDFADAGDLGLKPSHVRCVI